MRGWMPDGHRGAAAVAKQLAAIDENQEEFVALLDDPYGRGPPVELPDGSFHPRLPSIKRWIWDEDFCGSIGLRWQAGTSALPPYVLGHIGFNIVGWKRCRGYATEALEQMLPLAREYGLETVELTTDVDNVASQKVVLANGGRFVERFSKPMAYGAGDALRFVIKL